MRSDIGRTFTNFYSSFKSFFLFTESPRSNSLLECPMSIYEVLKNEIIRNGPIRARGDGMYFSDEIFRE